MLIVILDEGLYGDWLFAPVSASREFLRQYPSDGLFPEARPIR